MAFTSTKSSAQTQTGFRGFRGLNSKNFGNWLRLLFLFVFAALTLMPFVWVISTSLRTPAQSFTVPPEWIPVDMDFSNYTRVFEEIPFWDQIGNSFIITISVVVGQLVTASLAGYSFARLRFPGRNVLFWIVLATLMIPGQATIIPVFILISRVFGLNDTLWALIIPGLS
ncbi:MAG: carbohydrate ABC transporter permease, partial [Anaerolineae bacterium]|nr:carbohydrate ABC transporter permease [Anaerolineae bacterium]